MYKKELAILGVLIAVAMSSLMFTTPTGMTDTTKTQGYICVKYESIDGIIDLGCTKNTVTNIAKNQTRDVRAGAQGTVNTTWGSLLLSDGTTGPAATDATCEATVFTSNGCAAANGTVSTTGLSIGNYSVTNKFTATGACAAIAKVCLSNNTISTSPLMASALLSSAVTLAANENLTIIYYIGET